MVNHDSAMQSLRAGWPYREKRDTALTRAQRCSHLVSAPHFSAIKLDQSGIQYSHFSLVRTISGKEKILYYRELLVSEKFFKTCWFPFVLPSPVILGENVFYYRELLVSERFLYNTGFPLWFYSLRRVSGLFWAKSIISFFFKFIHWFKIGIVQ